MDDPPSYSFLDTLLSNNQLYFLITVVLLLIAGLISTIESALFSLTSENLDSFRNGRSRGEKIILELLNTPRLLLSALTTWKYFTVIGAAVIFTLGIQFSTGTELVLASLTLTLAFAFFSVIVPKIFGTANNTIVSKKASQLTSSLIAIVWPLIAPLLKLSHRVERKLEAIVEENSVKELTQALELAAADKETTEDEKEILRGIVNFGTLTVKQVMRPRNEISSPDASMNFHDLLIYIKKSGFSRLPVSHDTLDKIEGVLYIKDLLPFLDHNKTFDWRKLLRPAYFVSENKKIDLLLKDFQEKHVHMALVINDLGKVSGLITLEDIIEEIFGDIHDEFDEVGAYYKKIDEHTFMVDSKIPVYEFCRILGIEPSIFESVKSENETMGEVLLELLDDLPKIGDQITLEQLNFVLEAVDHKRIKKIRVHIQEQKES